MVDWEINFEGFFAFEKVLEGDELSSFREKNKNKKIVFTNGFFDLLHPGHLLLLFQARQIGDILVVGVNSDVSITKEDSFAPESIKVSRVINDIESRVIMLTALFFVDFVIAFDEANPKDVIRKLRPDVLVKGIDWEGKDIAGADFVKNNGGQVLFLDSKTSVTTTEIIKRIRKLYPV